LPAICRRHSTRTAQNCTQQVSLRSLHCNLCGNPAVSGRMRSIKDQTRGCLTTKMQSPFNRRVGQYTHKAPAPILFPLNDAHSALEMSQKAQKTSRFLSSSRLRHSRLSNFDCPALQTFRKLSRTAITRCLLNQAKNSWQDEFEHVKVCLS
jgi:hypothetical protein